MISRHRERSAHVCIYPFLIIYLCCLCYSQSTSLLLNIKSVEDWFLPFVPRRSRRTNLISIPTQWKASVESPQCCHFRGLLQGRINKLEDHAVIAGSRIARTARNMCFRHWKSFPQGCTEECTRNCFSLEIYHKTTR